MITSNRASIAGIPYAEAAVDEAERGSIASIPNSFASSENRIYAIFEGLTVNAVGSEDQEIFFEIDANFYPDWTITAVNGTTAEISATFEGLSIEALATFTEPEVETVTISATFEGLTVSAVGEAGTPPLADSFVVTGKADPRLRLSGWTVEDA